MKLKNISSFLLLSFTSCLAVIIFLRNNNLGNSFFRLFVSIPYYDKIGHFTLMGILAFLAVISIAPLLNYHLAKSTLIVLSVVLSLIAIEECSQIFIVTRSFSAIDFMCDLLGVATFGFLAYFWLNRMAQNNT